MSFLVDIVLIGIFLAVIAAYARKSIFAAGMGTLATVVAVVASLFLTPLTAASVAQCTLTPLLERTVAEELADMYSVPHFATATETAEALPIAQILGERSERYVDLLAKYHVNADTVEAVWRTESQGIAVVRCIAAPLATVLSETAVFLLMSILLTLMLQLIVRRVEQNLPPQRRYHGVKRALPALFGVLCGLLWSWVAVTVLSWVVPQTAEQLVFLTPDVLAKAEWYGWLQSINPLRWFIV